MIIDISEVDKTKFKCYKFEEGSLYYGETEYVDEHKNNSIVNILLKKVADINEYNEDMIKKLKMVRHGSGVQIFGANENNFEGEWLKDKKHGKGIFYFSDKSIYEGNFLEDSFHGYGKFTFPLMDVYIGEWKEGRMEGEGEFKHHDGHVLKGLFKNNYYLDVLIGIKIER